MTTSTPPPPTLTTLPYEILSQILNKLTIQRRVSVLSLNRRLYFDSASLHLDHIFRERPERFLYLGVSGNTLRLQSHFSALRERQCCFEAHCTHVARLTDSHVTPLLFASAARHGQLDFMYLLRTLCPALPLANTTLDAASQGGCLKVLDALLSPDSKLVAKDQLWPDTTQGNALANAAAEGHCDVLEWLISHNAIVSHLPLKLLLCKAVDLAAANGHLLAVEFLVAAWRNESDPDLDIEFPKEYPCSVKALNMAAKNGHLPVVEYLHGIHAPATKDALDQASGHGHIAVVKFLHKNRNEGCTVKAMDFASLRGHLAVVSFLHENRKEGCTPDALNYAASRGQMKVVKFLLNCRREGRVSDAARYAQKSGHTAVYNFLLGQEKRREPKGKKR
ncbi:hypothetical protein HDU98_002486 [Podochytrium sp. JEL0797]|nr:hypothetical protein HDU98_002486 [Podochytrium sp. JEL0797]